MRDRAGLLLLPALALSGCISYCKAEPTLARAGKGDLRAIGEAGDLGRPRIPSTAENLPILSRAFDTLQPLLSDTEESRRVQVVEALRHLSERAPDVYRNGFPGLFEASLSDPYAEVRWRAAWALGRLRETSPGLRLAGTDPNDAVAAAALDALGCTFDEAALPALARGLDRSASVQRAAIGALEKLAGRSLPSVSAWKAWIEEREKARAALPRGASPDTSPVRT